MGGVLKTADDMIEFYADILNRYPAVVALIDPLRKQVRIGSCSTCTVEPSML